ncbi:Cytochrome c556 [Neorhodopirellula lusitana]|uniref:Cytochrome c556 n=1 Tax=Neorhodopirellula lusitana TaxID=445327 RepID=A0ABY1PNJ6_9BACT|nr:Cytochrome c556 [Neorhodopirellula lusitana]
MEFELTALPSFSRCAVLRFAIVVVLGLTCQGSVWAQRQRAEPPVFNEGAVSRVFFPDLSKAFRGERPTLSSLRKAGAEAATAEAEGEGESESGGGRRWNKLISPISLEDEIKRVKLKYDASITTPGAFNGGGYQDARLQLSILASLFAVISEYSGDVRWKSDARTARDLTAKTALACAAGSTPVYKEAQLRKADLQDLVSGAGLSASKTADEENDWSMIVDRGPMMEYAESLLDLIGDQSRDAATTKENADSVRRLAELIAVLGEVLVQEGMDDADDEDYAKFSHAMTQAATSVVAAIERQDFEAVRGSVGAITQSCSDCHEEYR